MIRKHAPNIAALALASSAALLLGACGGGGTTDPDGTVVDPAAAPDATEPVVDAAPEAPATDAMPTEEPAVAAAEDVGDAVEDVGDAVEDGWIAMQSDWESSAGLVKDRWAELTEEEILGTGGDRDQLVVLVQEKYGIEREQAEQEVGDWAATL